MVLFALQITFGLGLLAFMVWQADVRATIALWKRAHAGWLAAGFGAILLIYFLRSVVQQMIAAIDARIPLSKLFSVMLIGSFFSNILPSQVGGDVVRGVYLFPYFHSRSRTYASILYQRAVGALGTLAVAIAGGIWLLPGAWRIPLILIAVAAICGVVVVLFFERLVAWISRLLISGTKLGTGKVARGIGALCRIFESLLSYRRYRLISFVTFVCSCIDTLIGVIVYIIGARALGIHLSFEQALMAGSVTQLAVLLPLTPGGLGIGEGAFVVTGGVLGLPSEQAIAVGILCRCFVLGSSLLGGVIYAFHPMPAISRHHIQRIHQPEAQDTI